MAWIMCKSLHFLLLVYFFFSEYLEEERFERERKVNRDKLVNEVIGEGSPAGRLYEGSDSR